MDKYYELEILNWRAGAKVYLPYGLQTLLRRQGKEVFTSRGASFPLEHGIRAFTFIKACRDKGEEFVTNGRTIRLGHYKIDRITALGEVVAGCHRVPYNEIEMLAKEIGIA